MLLLLLVLLLLLLGDEKGTKCLGYNWATLSLVNINTGIWSSRLGVERKTEDLDL
jgi:hypothetical protein